MLGSSEGAWSNMLAEGNGQAFDAADASGEWRDNAAFLKLHTQNPRSNMDDRFDLQFVTGELTDGSSWSMLPTRSTCSPMTEHTRSVPRLTRIRELLPPCYLP